MKCEEIINSIDLKKRFCKDYNLPVTVFDTPYFEHRLKTISLLPQYGNCLDKYELFCSEVGIFSNEQLYFEHYNNLKDMVMSHIKNSTVWQNFNKTNVLSAIPPYPDRNMYINDNDGRKFISIDMRQANYTVFKRFCDDYNDDIFDNCDTWEEFIGQFTDCRHIIESKYVRQVIFGNCNPKKQIQYEKSIMDMLAWKIATNLFRFGMTAENIFCVHNDEIIINGDSFTDKSFDNFKELVKNNYCDSIIPGERLKVEWFVLRKIPNTSGWLKINPAWDGKNEIMAVSVKGVDAEILPQIAKYLAELPIEDEDLVFLHNGQLAKFLSPIKNPFCKRD